MFVVASHGDFPHFEMPPVVEVALAVAFEPLPLLTVPQVGLLWNQEFREDFPEVQEQGPVEPMAERFGLTPQPFGISLQALEGPPIPRLWFVNPDGSEIIQVQRNWFAHNWRRVNEQVPYPRYEHVRGTFDTEFERFEGFVRDEKLGHISPTQLEVTYVNHLVLDEQLLPTVGSIHQVLSILGPPPEFLPEPEELAMNVSFVIPDDSGAPIGRLRVSFQPLFDAASKHQIVLLTLTARGGVTHEDRFRFLDIAHEWIVRGFAALTTDASHRAWGRTS